MYYRSGKAIYYNNGKTVDSPDELIADCESVEKADFLLQTVQQRSEYFIKDALVTCSPEFHGDMVAWNEFKGRLNGAIDALNKLDQVKKTLFYGRDNNLISEGQRDASDIPTGIDSSRGVAVDIIHAILGNATEAGELLEALKLAINGNGFDWVNIQEELGDQAWYNAILAARGDFTFEDYEQRIIRKLRVRYADKFTSTEAIKRNLNVERLVLEAKEETLTEGSAALRLGPTPPASGKDAVEAITPAVDKAFDVLNVPDNSVPAIEHGTNSELAKFPGARLHNLPGEELAQQPIRPEDAKK